jgi:hypothetical protein
MKKYILISLISLALVSCSKMLDVEPTQSIDANTALNSKKGIERAVNGMYDALQQTGLYGRFAAVAGDLAADNLDWTGTTLDYGQLTSKSITTNNAIVEGLWASSYDAINRANSILDHIADVGDMAEAEKKQASGECLYVRALCHFELMRFYGSVPLKLQATVGLENVNVARSSKQEVINVVIDDLAKAAAYLGDMPAGYASQKSAKALLARAYLYNSYITTENNKIAEAAKASAMADEVIASGAELVAKYEGLWLPDANGESLFEVTFNAQDRNVIAQYFYPRLLTGRYEFAPSASLINCYEAGDLRKTASIATDASNFVYGNKYRDLSAGADRVYVVRTAELYAIKAEAALIAGNTAGVLANLNVLRSRAGLSPLENTSAYTPLELLLQECRAEFAFEGHRWHDLVRTGKATEVLGIDQNHTLFPIPLSEMQTNKLMTQNPGY